jgi:hypothetical protein
VARQVSDMTGSVDIMREEVSLCWGLETDLLVWPCGFRFGLVVFPKWFALLVSPDWFGLVIFSITFSPENFSRL